MNNDNCLWQSTHEQKILVNAKPQTLIPFSETNKN